MAGAEDEVVLVSIPIPELVAERIRAIAPDRDDMNGLLLEWVVIGLRHYELADIVSRMKKGE